MRFANNQLLAGSASLTNGLSEAKSGSQKLANGASLLESRSGALIDGTSQLASGADTLANKLADASNRIKIQPTGATTQQQIANPVKSEVTEKGNVPNYGYAFVAVCFVAKFVCWSNCPERYLSDSQNFF